MYLAILIPLVIGIVLLLRLQVFSNYVIALFVFAITPALTISGAIGNLTGFSPSSNSPIYFGVSFYTLFLAYHIKKNPTDIRARPFKTILLAANPLYLYTGPVPRATKTPRKVIKRFIRRFNIIQSYLIVGAFFSFILAPSYSPFLSLRTHTNTLDILLFGFAAELYVYFNFCGYSLLAWSCLRLIGIVVPGNFNQPFSSKSIVEYWKRWHISLGAITKELFYQPIRKKFNVYIGAIASFMASAVWHGGTTNFIAWGVFHAFNWCLTYYLLKRKHTFLVFCILLLDIVGGRIISTEPSSDQLVYKLSAVANPLIWSSAHSLGTIVFTKIQVLGILLGLLVVATEALAKSSAMTNKYVYLRNPICSVFALLGIVVMYSGAVEAPFYGVR